ncbi:hypothetical protein NP493_427g00009 [Ridgeia piscesae]|uniref:Uncharacterized protein n=1 Tax=Ridgeia piscesae TaxID=27915 RepID=A0AAD9L025_RIDPI|nr:hypothetical protein NP493_427g00009 [Ridgeia piscesae]
MMACTCSRKSTWLLLPRQPSVVKATRARWYQYHSLGGALVVNETAVLCRHVGPVFRHVDHRRGIHDTIAEGVAYFSTDPIGYPISAFETFGSCRHDNDVLHVSPCESGTGSTHFMSPTLTHTSCHQL